MRQRELIDYCTDSDNECDVCPYDAECDVYINMYGTTPTCEEYDNPERYTDKELPTVPPERTKERTEMHACDLIDRQAAIDALIGAVKKVGILDADDIKAVFDMLLTIQPEERTEKRTEMHGVCLDAISRQAAIDAIEKMNIPEDMCVFEILSHIEVEIATLPPAQPERKKGEWVEISSINHTYKCSECGRLLVNVADGRNNVSKHYPYCHCGAKMTISTK